LIGGTNKASLLLKRLNSLNAKVKTLLESRQEHGRLTEADLFNRESFFWRQSHHQIDEKAVNLYCSWQRCIREKCMIRADLELLLKHQVQDGKDIRTFLVTESRAFVTSELNRKLSNSQRIINTITTFLDKENIII
jgi:hypothetical protein